MCIFYISDTDILANNDSAPTVEGLYKMLRLHIEKNWVIFKKNNIIFANDV